LPLGLLLVCACASQTSRFELDIAAQSAVVPVSRALIQLGPGGPAIAGVTETSYSNAVMQHVVLSTRAATPGQNEFIVRAYRAGPADENEPATLGDRVLSSYAIGRELEDRFPGVEMSIGQAYSQNKYGPFGYALGRPGNGDLCLYAWQRIEKTNRSLLSREGGAVSIRLRLCDRDRTEAELLGVFYGFTFVGYSRAHGWDPFDDPPGPPEALGATSSPIYPVSPHATYEGNVHPQRERITTAPKARAVPRPPPEVDEAVEVEPLPGYPTVPAPPAGSGSTGR
jgi:hypothetical protein